ncbi:uncharacterized protein LOC135501760 [Lineus longissimus]
MWIHGGKLFTNLDAHTGHSHMQFHIAPPTKKWSFVGISYSQQTGNLVMWVDGNVVIKNVGAIGLRDMLGDLYVGLRPANGGSKFTGKLAGTTLMRCAVSGKAQIEELRKLIISRAKPATCDTQMKTKVASGVTYTFAGMQYYCKDDGKYAEVKKVGNCAIPFKYKGVWYSGCIDSKPWCSKDHVYTKNWEYC